MSFTPGSFYNSLYPDVTSYILTYNPKSVRDYMRSIGNPPQLNKEQEEMVKHILEAEGYPNPPIR